jgi:outer membrane receptor for ferrienterochelin and colicins
LGLLCVINMTTTPATVEEDINWFPACLFRTKLNWMTPKILLGARYDVKSRLYFTQRLAYKWKINDLNILRLTLEQA